MTHLTDAGLRARAQRLIGAARGAYENDRAACRASLVLPPLLEAFDILIYLRRRDNPNTEECRLPEWEGRLE